MSNVVHIPRPRISRSRPDPFAFYVRVGFNDHLELLDLLATGEKGMFGFVIEAQNVARHRELMTEARRRGFDIILDPKTHPLALPYGHKESLGALPWGGERHHTLADFDGAAGHDKVARIVAFAADHDFTQILGPTHLLAGANDPWLRRDIAMMNRTSEEIASSGKRIRLLYPLALPMAVFRKQDERQAILSAIGDAPCEALWLKVENFGDNSTGEKTASYIAACRELNERRVPVVGDHIGGLPALGALALGGLGGMAHGVTVQQSFSASNWRRPSVSKDGGGSGWRVYLPSLDLLMKPKDAETFMQNPRLKAKCGCRDTHCCPHGVRDMIDRPVRHALYQRAREIEQLGTTAPSLRATAYMDERVRRVSDDVASIAAMSNLNDDFVARLRKKQAHMSRFREAMAHLAESVPSEPAALSPRRWVDE